MGKANKIETSAINISSVYFGKFRQDFRQSLKIQWDLGKVNVPEVIISFDILTFLSVNKRTSFYNF